MSFIKRLFHIDDPNNAPKKTWDNQELEVYFDPQPNDQVWKAVSINNVEQIQQAFQEICRSARLDTYNSTNDLPYEVIETICKIANETGAKFNINPFHIILISHQYVDADKVMRQMYKSRWIAFMVKRADYAPQPETYLEYIKGTYFSN